MSLKEFGYMSVRLKVREEKKVNTFPSSPARSCIKFSALKCGSSGVSRTTKAGAHCFTQEEYALLCCACVPFKHCYGLY